MFLFGKLMQSSIAMNIVFYLHDEPDSAYFEQKLLWLKKHYHFVSTQDYIDYIYNNKKLKNACLLTIDDGWKSTYDIIYPLLKKYNIPALVFISPRIYNESFNYWYYLLKYCKDKDAIDYLVEKGYFSKKVSEFDIKSILKTLNIDLINEVIEFCFNKRNISNPSRAFLSKEEIIEMKNSGLVEFGAHTVNHPILSNETDAKASYEIVESINILSEILGCKVRTFAYPNGIENLDFSEREKEILRKSQVQLAFSVNNFCVKRNSNPMSIPRIGSIARLKFGYLGQYLPTRTNQRSIRDKIKNLKLF